MKTRKKANAAPDTDIAMIATAPSFSPFPYFAWLIEVHNIYGFATFFAKLTVFFS